MVWGCVWEATSAPATREGVRLGAQQGVVADEFAMAGPDTDTLVGENRQKNGTGVHMSAVGLKAHGAAWAEIVGKWVEREVKS